MQKRIANFKREDGGNVAMIAALSVIPIISVVGFAMDLQMTTTQRAAVQAAVDSAIIAGAKSLQVGKTTKDIEVEVNAYVEALVNNKARGTTCGAVRVYEGATAETLRAEITCTQKTTLTHMFGQETIKFSISSGSAYGVGDVEVAMVFDVSGSMDNSGRMDSLKEAANNAVEILMPKDEKTGQVQNKGMRISMVTYDTMMNAGNYFKKATGLEKSRIIEAEYKICTKTEWKRKHGRWRKVCVKHKEAVKKFTVNSSCVSERVGDEAFTDAKPQNDQWITPAKTTVKNSYGGVPKSVSTPSCNEFGPQPLTHNRQKLEKYIKDIEPRGGTAGHLGVAWGWYTLSPHWDRVWPSAHTPADYEATKVTKAIIMMTDGEFNTEYEDSLGDSSEQAIKLCDKIKDESILIYTVAFQAPSSGKETLKACATSDEYAFEPKNASELNDAYANIARSISDLRISH